MKILKKIIEYLRFPSTWKGLIAIAAAAGLTFTDAQAEAIMGAALGVIGMIQVFIDDRTAA